MKATLYCPLHCGSMSAWACLQLERRFHTDSLSLCVGFLAQFLWWPGVCLSEPLHLSTSWACLEQSKYYKQCFLNLCTGVIIYEISSLLRIWLIKLTTNLLNKLWNQTYFIFKYLLCKHKEHYLLEKMWELSSYTQKVKV